MIVERRFAKRRSSDHFSKADWTWFYIVASLWVMFTWSSFVPASYWYDIEGMTVYDTQAGQVPKIDVRRKINNPFYGEWTVEVMRLGSFGATSICTSSGRNYYHPENALPEGDDLNLNWWTFPVECKLKPGRYLVRTNIILHPDGWPVKQVNFNSNIFRVY